MKLSRILRGATYLSVLLLITTLFGNAPAAKRIVFPGKTWERRTPAAAGINTAALARIDSVMKAARSNGVLIKDGYLVAEWNYQGGSDSKIEVQSITKTLSSLVLGIALKEGKIPGLDVFVKDYYPMFNVGPHTNEITFRHLATATSGIKAQRYGSRYQDPGNMPPGIKHIYHNDHMAQLCEALTYIYKEPLLNIAKTRVLNVIGANIEWGLDKTKIKLENGRELDVVAGYAFSKWTAEGLARFGWLYLNNGSWKGRQLISEQYARESRKQAALPFDGNVPEGQSKTEKQLANYGLGWRCTFDKNGNILWYMSGNGGQFCLVVPEKGLVFTKINGIGTDHQPFRGLSEFKEFIATLIK